MKRQRALPAPPPSSEITPEAVYLNRRAFLSAAGIFGAGALLAACGVKEQPTATPAAGLSVGSRADDLGDPLTPLEAVTNYNNYYEFTTDKEGVAGLAKDFRVRPWTVEVGGLVHKPATFAIDDLLTAFSQDERIYRLRCVEAWSMVIPWNGFELGRLLDQVEPMSSAAYVGFTTLLDPEQMPGQRSRLYPWPYTEGLRLDEAMHTLTLLSTGLYGQPLLPQNGAPLRLVVPWKYGFKSIKSIVRIDLLEQPPATMWSAIAPQEYGFYANVNPQVNHPRWSQGSERRIGEGGRRETLMFNGYADQVAGLYSSMDLQTNY
ncbi:MAG: protein-methionine-sulfoxide reductase catalytic subunit MsrP [Anaerolineales bacterium]|nr:protein-methionine-sulfoxide reductase catalytic subunit MsrP [Anaerolineales bacterium]